MSTPTSIEDRVKKVIREQMAIYGSFAPDAISNDFSLADDAGFDSLDRVEVAIGLESEFGIEIEDTVVWAMTTVQDAINAVTNAQGVSA
ncbi:acyl carrier protein [Paraburkholderia atlantica]|uniref:acyl carrier protein n=1 Tax=Paraburkholderia atlantica TaxID=2654982 RepID=UPI0017FC7FC4|nr:acyl carrier protein [Paraburkholderia atlantica]MBB5414059.1 acyl carrier protein [Paraburkholderia atlantica]